MAMLKAFALLLAVCSTCVSGYTVSREDGAVASNPYIKCTHRKLDIAILLDSSQSVGLENFNIVKGFLVDLVRRYHVGRDQTRVGLIVFHDRFEKNTRVEFYLNQYFDTVALQEQISKTVYMPRGVTRMDLALKYADEKMFTTRNGMRGDALQKIFLVTDGVQNPEYMTDPKYKYLNLHNHYEIAKKLRERRNVEIYAIGVGAVDKNELNQLTGDPKKVFLKNDFAELKSEEFVHKLSQFNCIARLPTQPPKPPMRCTHRKLDIAILLDASGSIMQSNFEKMKTFMVQLIRKYPFHGHNDNTRVALIVFHNRLPQNTRVEFLLNRYFTEREIEDHVRDVIYTEKGLTRMDLALKYANEQVFNEMNGMRKDALQKIFLVTDGVQNPSLNPKRANQLQARPSDRVLDHYAIARTLRSRGVEIYAIGIDGTNVDTEELKDLTGDPKRVFVRDDFDELISDEFIYKLAQFNCVPLVKTTTTTTTTIQPTYDPRPQPILECKQKLLDVAILLDRSGNIRDENFRKMLSFLTKLIATYHVGEDDTRVSLTVFSDDAEGMFYLNRYYNKDDLLYEVETTTVVKGETRMETRIDLALQHAVEKVFTIRNGMRPGALQKAFLITDGVQNPSLYKNPNNRNQREPRPGDNVLDHYAIAKKLRDKNVDIYAIGIGNIDENELNKVTADRNKVFLRDNFDDLLETEFVRKIMKASCERRIVTTPSPAPNPCRGVDRCSTCCSGSDVYNIVFHPNSGPNYIFTGMRMSQSSPNESLKGILMYPNVLQNQVNTGKGNAIATFAKQLSSDSRRQLLDLLLSMQRKRSRRSIDEHTHSERKMDLVKGLGCTKFLDELKKDASLKRAVDLENEGHNLTIFCPKDAALDNISQEKLKTLLPEHIAVQHGQHKVMFNSLAGGKILLSPSGNKSAEIAWKANGVDVLSSHGSLSEIMIIDGFIEPRHAGVQDILKGNGDVSIFYNMLKSTPLLSLVQKMNVEKVCFAKDICLPVTPSMQDHLRDVIAFNQFTIVAPTDSSFESMSQADLKELTNNAQKRTEFLKKHIYIGDIRNTGNVNRAVGFSLSSNHSIITMNKDEQGVVLIDADNQLFKVVHSHPVREGVIFVVNKVE